MVYQNISELIGRTPIVRIKSPTGSNLELFIKMESFNPGGSVKDRIALGMILDAEQKGKLYPGATLIEPSSGNTGIALAMLGATRGYKVVLVMPDTMSVERRHLMKAYGAEIVLTPGAEGMSGAVRKARSCARNIPTGLCCSNLRILPILLFIIKLPVRKYTKLWRGGLTISFWEWVPAEL